MSQQALQWVIRRRRRRRRSIHSPRLDLKMINCYRELQDNNPFIGKDLELSLSVKKVGEEKYQGVNFTNLIDNVSPHISQTHCECALHVFCREVASSLSDTLAAKSELLESLPALHIKVPTVATAALLKSVTNVDGVYTADFGVDSYSIVSDNEVTAATFANDRVVTKASMEDAVKNHSNGGAFKVLLIDLLGEEDCMTNWAYLTNEAMKYIVQELGVEVVVVNTASVDRESDGGFVPNHKIIFENRHHLVIELAKLSYLKASLGNVMLNIEPHNTYADCGPSKLQFTPV
eukprot:gene24050-27210_t